MRKSKVLAGLLAGTMMVSQLFPLHAQADAYKVVTLGANLSEEQKASILRFFGVNEGEVEILIITNEDERAQLQDLIPIEQIGTRTYSCALVNPTTSGGIQVKTANMNYVTSNMIASTLSTSGVVNCDVLTAAPFEVSGTGALTGVMMAYETASGETLDEEKKELANEELVTTNQIADTVGQDEATLIVNDIKIHIIRDEVKEQEEVNTVVDTVIDTAEAATAERAADKGMEKPDKLHQSDRELLYSFGYKVAQADYKYDDVKVTLQRVAQNVAETTGIEDPILGTFDSVEEEALASDCILMNTDDEALGEDTQINATNQDAMADTSDDSQDVSGEIVDRVEGDLVSIEKIGMIQNARWIYDTSLLQIDGEAGQYMADLDGTALTGALYGGFTGDNGYVMAYELKEECNRYGLFSQKGTVLMPFQYGTIELENEHWAVGAVLKEASSDNYDFEDSYNDCYYLIDTVDLYYLEEETSSLVATLNRDQIADFCGMGSYINIQDRTSGIISCYDSSFCQVASGLKDIYSEPDGIITDPYQTFSENGQQGLADADGNVLISPSYRYMDLPVGDHLVVSTGEKEGLMDLSGNLLIPAEYDSIVASYTLPIRGYSNSSRGYVANGYVVVEQDGKTGYCDINGNVTCEPVISSEVLETNGASSVYDDMEGKQHILAADGKDTVVEGYDSVACLYFGSGMLYETSDENYNSGLIDWHGNVLLPVEYWDVDISADGQYLLLNLDGDNCVLYKITYTGPTYSGVSNAVQETSLTEETEENAVQPESMTEAAEMTQPESGAEMTEAVQTEGSSDTAAAEQLLETACSLLVSDPETNRQTAAILIGQAAEQIRSSYPDAAVLLDSAVTLINSGVSDDGSVNVLIGKALEQLG